MRYTLIVLMLAGCGSNSEGLKEEPMPKTSGAGGSMMDAQVYIPDAGTETSSPDVQVYIPDAQMPDMRAPDMLVIQQPDAMPVQQQPDAGLKACMWTLGRFCWTSAREYEGQLRANMATGLRVTACTPPAAPDRCSEMGQDVTVTGCVRCNWINSAMTPLTGCYYRYSANAVYWCQ